jgi:hypothetical protein
MSNVRDLVDALLSGDSIGIDDSFNAVMADKVNSALDDHRVQVAKTMFAPPNVEEESDDNIY